MSVKSSVQRQNARMVDRIAPRMDEINAPEEGWLKTIRAALGMSGSHVAKRINVTRAAIYQAERNEREGAITLRQMEKLADAMGAKFVYAVVPDGSVNEVLERQAVYKATLQMGSETASLPPIKLREKIKSLASEILRERPIDFWDE